jgi:hypothetical protein
MSAGDFLALPLPDRVKLILHRETCFYLTGQPVDRQLAMKALLDLVRQGSAF